MASSSSRLFINIRTCSTSFLAARSTFASTSRVVNSSLRFRTMASSAAGKKIEWLVVVPDFAGAGQKRLEIRPQHFANLGPQVSSGAFKMGGAVLNEPPTSSDPTTFNFAGSTVVILAESREEIKEALRKDVYAKEGVWDVENAQMWPLLCAFRYPVPGQEQKFPEPGKQ
ncbi:hypothetical protein QBC42DRAFT_280207 [Cladorrhinum samala]|uniref:YCII-related domain-containing protein n=1 Tax=Cladorrhinum samala TaxID=585594 RepID=A0AAV9H925_9PEZI|nr:hypothetical protein QBC42DRAFT_280207 [Cladorrhinum samala]